MLLDFDSLLIWAIVMTRCFDLIWRLILRSWVRFLHHSEIHQCLSRTKCGFLISDALLQGMMISCPFLWRLLWTKSHAVAAQVRWFLFVWAISALQGSFLPVVALDNCYQGFRFVSDWLLYVCCRSFALRLKKTIVYWGVCTAWLFESGGAARRRNDLVVGWFQLNVQDLTLYLLHTRAIDRLVLQTVLLDLPRWWAILITVDPYARQMLPRRWRAST